MDSILKYTDEDDKCYGLTGMAIAMVIYDAEGMLSSIWLDAPAGQSMEFTGDYYFSGAPNVSAKSAWSKVIEHFRLSASMMLSNVACRHRVRRGDRVSQGELRALRRMMEDEGREACSLDTDEVDALFDRTAAEVDRIFAHPGVGRVARGFADTLQQQRRMSRGDVMDALSALHMM